MMRKLSRFICLFLIIAFVFSAVSCGGSSSDHSGNQTDGNQNTSDKGQDASSDDEPYIVPDGNYIQYGSQIADVTGTIHQRSVSYTDEKIVSRGKSSYKIVISKTDDGNGLKGARDFNNLFEEATGFQLPVITDDGLSYNAKGKYISLGKNAFSESADLGVDYHVLGNQGYEIITKGNTIFVAANAKGIAYGVYDLLNVLLNYEVYTVYYYSLNKNVTELDLPDLRIKEVPDFDYRIAPYGSVFSLSTDTRNRMRFMHTANYFIKDCQTHSAFRIVFGIDDPKRQEELNAAFAEHPKWVSTDKAQLCYTARGDATEYEALVARSVERCKELILADPYHDILSFSQRDYNTWCTCPSCTALYQKYNTDAASQIIFINEVAKRVEQWLTNENIGRDIMFDILVYHKTENAPTVKNADGTYSPIDDKVVLRSNVQLFFAPIFGDFVSGIMSEKNANLRTLFESWAPISQNYACWGYDSHFKAYLSSYDTFGSMQDMCKYLYNMGVNTYFPQGSYNLSQSSNFDNLKTYLYSKLLWNVNSDINALTDAYFNGLYREAGPQMKQCYYQQRAELFEHRLKGMKLTTSDDDVSEDYYSERYLVNQIESINSAKKHIEKYAESDPEYYKIVCDEINLETIGARYLMLVLYSGVFSDIEYKEFTRQFINDVEKLEVNKIDEVTFMSSFTAGL